MSRSFHFDADEPVTVGTLGPKGQRVFYLQCRSRNGPVSFKMEKQQVAALAEYLDRMLDGLPPAPAGGAATEAGDSSADFDLRAPVEAEWAVGNMGVAYDGDGDRIILVAEERAEDDDEDEGENPEAEPAAARFTLTRAQVAGFVGRARTVVAAGRPPCPYCARPLEEAHGDWCPCHN